MIPTFRLLLGFVVFMVLGLLGVSSDLGPIPDPSVRPTVTVEEAGKWLGLSRSSAYTAAARGEIPVLRFNARSLRVPTAALRRMLGIDPEVATEEPSAVVVPVRGGGIG